MDGKICLDTDACINIINNKHNITKVLDRLEGDLAFVSTITVFELHMRKTNVSEVQAFLESVYFLPFDDVAAIEASNIMKNLQRKGKPVGFRDVFIAATAITNDCRLLTFNKKHYEDIKELEIVTI